MRLGTDQTVDRKRIQPSNSSTNMQLSTARFSASSQNPNQIKIALTPQACITADDLCYPAVSRSNRGE